LEYITGGGLINESIPESLAREGDLMLTALLNDLLPLDEVELTVFRDYRLGPLLALVQYENLNVQILTPNQNFHETWKSAIEQSDAVWPIAPETNGVLAELSLDVELASRILLNSPSEAISLTASKIKTLERCNEYGIRTVPTVLLEQFADEFHGPWVIKPDDGVGGEGSWIVTKRNHLDDLKSEQHSHKLIVQPLITGESGSLSLLFDTTGHRFLSFNKQYIKRVGGRLHLAGCSVNVVDEYWNIYHDLGRSIARAFPTLWGYVGVDFIGCGDQAKVLEINPRLTTSFVGLASALGINVASMILDMLHRPLGETATPLHRRTRFDINLEEPFV